MRDKNEDPADYVRSGVQHFTVRTSGETAGVRSTGLGQTDFFCTFCFLKTSSTKLLKYLFLQHKVVAVEVHPYFHVK